MAEKLTLTNPLSVTDYTFNGVEFNWKDKFILVRLEDTTGKELRITYTGTEATTLMNALNKANLSTTSLVKRIFNQLTSDNKLTAGTVTGTPD